MIAQILLALTTWKQINNVETFIIGNFLHKKHGQWNPLFPYLFYGFFFFWGVIGNMASEIIVVKDVALSSKFDAIAFDGHNKSINKIFVSSRVNSCL